MQQVNELVNLRVHDGLSHKRHGAVLQRHGLLHAVLLHALTAGELLDQALLNTQEKTYALVHDHALIHLLRGIHLPAPGAACGVGVVSPAEQAAVSARQRRGGLHAGCAIQAVEGVLIASTIPAEMGLAPAAELHSASESEYPMPTCAIQPLHNPASAGYCAVHG